MFVWYHFAKQIYIDLSITHKIRYLAGLLMFARFYDQNLKIEFFKKQNL